MPHRYGKLTCHMVSQCYHCHTQRWESPPLPPAKAGTRFSDPGRMQGWVEQCYMKADRLGIEPARDLSVASPMPYRSATTHHSTSHAMKQYCFCYYTTCRPCRVFQKRLPKRVLWIALVKNFTAKKRCTTNNIEARNYRRITKDTINTKTNNHNKYVRPRNTRKWVALSIHARFI